MRLAELWRSKQLEYTFRREPMAAYRPFPEITRAALEYACATLDVTLSDDAKSALMKQYRTLEAFGEAPAADRSSIKLSSTASV